MDRKLCGKREGEGLDPEAHGIFGVAAPASTGRLFGGFNSWNSLSSCSFLFSFSSFDEVMIDK